MTRSATLLAVTTLLAGPRLSGSSDMYMYIPFQSTHDKSKGRTCYVTAEHVSETCTTPGTSCNSGNDETGTSVFQLYIAAVSSSSPASLTLLLRSPLHADERRQRLHAQGHTGRAAVCVQMIDDAGRASGRACAGMDATSEALDAGVPVVWPLPPDTAATTTSTHLLHLWVDHVLSAAAAGNADSGRTPAEAPCCGDATDVYFAADLKLPHGGAQVPHAHCPMVTAPSFFILPLPRLRCV